MSKRRQWAVVAIVVGIPAISVAVYMAGWSTWPTLHRQVDRFESPPGFVEVSRKDEGTAVCIISCDEARVRILYSITGDPEDACKTLRAAVSAVTTDMKELVIGSDVCGGSGDMARVGGDATVGWAIRDADDAADDPYEVEWVSAEARDLDGLVATVVFNSGID